MLKIDYDNAAYGLVHTLLNCRVVPNIFHTLKINIAETKIFVNPVRKKYGRCSKIKTFLTIIPNFFPGQKKFLTGSAVIIVEKIKRRFRVGISSLNDNKTT